MASSFFSLPTDLQVEIFQTFLGCSDPGLHALAGLDSACCNHSQRPHSLSLMAIAFNKCKARVVHRKQWLFGDKMRWLLARGVDINKLALIGRHDDRLTAFRQEYAGYVHETALWMDSTHAYGNSAPLCYMDKDTVAPAVEKVAFEPSQYMRSVELDMLPTAFPNLTCLSARLMRESNSGTVELWTKLASMRLPNLKVLRVRNLKDRSDCALMAKAIQQHGSNLVELLLHERNATDGYDGSLLLKAIVQNCEKLQKLAITVYREVAADLVIALIHGNSSLTTLQLYKSPFYTADLIAILIAAKAQGALRVFQNCAWFSTDFNITGLQFATILERFAWLDVFQLNYVSFCRSTHSLVLTDVGLSEVCLDRIFSVCSPTTKLTVIAQGWRRDEPKDGTLQRIGERFGAQLLSLVFLDEVGQGGVPVRCQLIKQCSQLLSLTIVDDVDDEFAQYIAEHCKHLVTFACCPLIYGSARVITDTGALALLTACKQLLSVDLGMATITFRTLQTIVDNRLRLQAFTMGVRRSANAHVIARFNALAVEQQLIPIPRIEIRVVDVVLK